MKPGVIRCLHRLALGCFVTCLGFLLAQPVTASDTDRPPLDIVTLDWTLAETLVALGVMPQGVAQIDAYHEWVAEPRLAPEVHDLGLRTQPNLELLASLDPDRILLSPMFANLTPRLSRIAPVESFSLYTPDEDTWEQMLALTRQVASLVDREREGEHLIEASQALFDDLRSQLADDQPPLLVVQFMDARHVRVFGDNGLFQAVLERLALENAWTGVTNAWGFSLVGLDALVDIDARLVVVEPLPVGVESQLAESGLWRHLPSVQDDSVVYLPPTWSFGALPSAQRFAKTLVEALEASHAR
ncbi:iron-siderophore ABC transporter substrate-binding protein [Litchfieldella xinjiangensis]|uniref:iron-siderophore ABC transporter substrate-binding protein n=1 Tax=Litchfieldella xinjiangensis TaxID=1166948 RepID=UPI00069368E5|nr:iron-siderophore ABC transporter substrate-binding protein [Halomonas xinjiangensis]